MTLHPNQEILAAVQIGACSELHETNPYEPKDKKRFLGWEEGHIGVVEEHKEQQKWANTSLFRKILCKIGIHLHTLKRVPGRPHINPKSGDIDRRDRIIEKWTCVYCPNVYFIGLRG